MCGISSDCSSLLCLMACRDVGSKEKMGARKIVKYVWPINIWIDWVLLSMRLCIGDADGVERRGFCHDTSRLWLRLSQCHDEELSVHLALSIGNLEHFFMVDALQGSILHSHGPSHGGRAFLNLLRGPREKAVCSVLASDCSLLQEHGVHRSDPGLTGGLSYLTLSNWRRV